MTKKATVTFLKPFAGTGVFQGKQPGDVMELDTMTAKSLFFRGIVKYNEPDTTDSFGTKAEKSVLENKAEKHANPSNKKKG